MTECEEGSIGSPFADFLEEEGIADEVEHLAVKKVIAASLARRMEDRRISKTALAREMQTSRAQVNRLLDPENESVTLHTIQRAARVLGMRVRCTLA